jgi:hypothetical protein
MYSQLGCNVNQFDPISRQYLNQRSTYVSDMDSQLSIVEVDGLTGRIGRDCCLYFTPFEWSSRTDHPAQEPSCKFPF